MANLAEVEKNLQLLRTDVAIIFFGIGGPLSSQLEQQAAALVASRA